VWWNRKNWKFNDSLRKCIKKVLSKKLAPFDRPERAIAGDSQVCLAFLIIKDTRVVERCAHISMHGKPAGLIDILIATVTQVPSATALTSHSP
jgi:hypothetical protein